VVEEMEEKAKVADFARLEAVGRTSGSLTPLVEEEEEEGGMGGSDMGVQPPYGTRSHPEHCDDQAQDERMEDGMDID
jgi:hypothetical protein